MKTAALFLLLAVSALAQPATVNWIQGGTTFAATDLSYPTIPFLAGIQSGIRVCVPDRDATVRTLALTVTYAKPDGSTAYGTYLMPWMGTNNRQSCFQTLFNAFRAEQILWVIVAPSPAILSPQSNGGAQ